MRLTALLKSRRNTLLAAVLLLLFVVAAVIVFIAISPTLDFLKPQNSKPATSSANLQKASGSVYGFWGRITKIDKQGKGGPEENPEYESGVAYVGWEVDETRGF